MRTCTRCFATYNCLYFTLLFRLQSLHIAVYHGVSAVNVLTLSSALLQRSAAGYGNQYTVMPDAPCNLILSACSTLIVKGVGCVTTKVRVGRRKKHF